MIKSLLHVGIFVPDLNVGKKFYELFGLESREVGNHIVFRCPGRPQDQIRLIQGSKKRLAYLSLGTDAAGMEKMLGKLSESKVAVHRKAPFDLDLEGVWFQDPLGDWLNVQIAEPALSEVASPPEINAHGRYRRAGRACTPDSIGKRAQPLRLGHVIKFSPDVEKSTAFYTAVLGLKVSDRALDVLAFLRGSAGGDHHIIAFAKSSHTGLHHMSFEVRDIDEIEIGAQTLINAGYKDGFGLGRHVGGSNYFHYIRDPWGSLVEYFWDIDVIPEDDSSWVPLDVSPENLTAVWANTPPPLEFTVNYEEA